MQFYANSYVFQACLSPADAGAVLASLDEIESDPELLAGLHRKTAYFRGKLNTLGFDTGVSQSPIVPIYIPELKTLYAFGKALYEKGVFSVSVAYPAVKITEGRLRFIVNASHTMEQIDSTLDVLAESGRALGLIP
jgi:glycine C-acetyltransferase